METLLGKTLDRTYRLDQLLGKGGMGAVYKAHDVALNRDVALKIIHPHFTDDETFRARFLQEARAVAALDHPWHRQGVCVWAGPGAALHGDGLDPGSRPARLAQAAGG